LKLKLIQQEEEVILEENKTQEKETLLEEGVMLVEVEEINSQLMCLILIDMEEMVEDKIEILIFLI
jgi:lipopolysaccharide biosynthesis glycosyltransferase